MRVLLVAAMAMVVPLRSCGRADRLTVATFNIEDYPKSERQVAGAFALMSSLGASAIAVQEITEPLHFAAEARRRMGDEWRFVYAPMRGHRIGVLYDDDELELTGTQTHPDTIVGGAGKPAFEVRFLERRSSARVRMIVVHLKAGGDGVDMRGRQLAGLARILNRPDDPGSTLVVLGDFNATSELDRTRIAALAEGANLKWASEPLACTSFWNRRDGCRGSALDHVLSSAPVRSIAAKGPCEWTGCKERPQCPRFHRDVSDHCPVRLTTPLFAPNR